MLAVDASNGSRNLTHERGEVPKWRKKAERKRAARSARPLPGGGPATGRLLCSTFYFLLPLHSIPDSDPRHDIPLINRVDHFDSCDDTSEDCVARVEVRLRSVRNEELAAAGVAPRERHAD